MAHTRKSLLVSFPALEKLMFCLCFLQIVKPLWPFMIAGGITTFLVAKAQDSGIRCTSLFKLMLTLPTALTL